MKIPQLLVQYLYKNRRIALPGLGIFTLDKSVVLPDEHDRALLAMPNQVQFQNANIAAADKELISFICEHTGKIKPLAISDLDSYLNLGTEMLNIGKPFYLEGIGTITKNKTGKFDFAPGEYSLIKESQSSQEHGKKKGHVQETKQPAKPSSGQTGNLVKLLAVIGALAIVGWGGWMMYKKNSPATTEKIMDTVSTAQVKPTAKSDSLTDSTANHQPPTANRQPPTLNGQPINYKFVILATSNKPHAIRRYNQLSGFNLKIHLYQKDSTYFKVYFQFPALAKDTTHIKDSLRMEYAHEVMIEQ